MKRYLLTIWRSDRDEPDTELTEEINPWDPGGLGWTITSYLMRPEVKRVTVEEAP